MFKVKTFTDSNLQQQSHEIEMWLNNLETDSYTIEVVAVNSVSLATTMVIVKLVYP